MSRSEASSRLSGLTQISAAQDGGFLEVLNNLRIGKCSEKSLAYIQDVLCKPLQVFGEVKFSNLRP